MILEIKQYPDPVLEKKCREVEKIDERTKKLIEDMFETMYAHRGIGLAASQVGVSERIVVVDIGDGPRVFINPKILKKKGKVLSEEGCLSVPGAFLKVKRAEKITVEALNEKGEKFDLEVNGLLSRCIQQEIDHLNGILILNKISILEKIIKKLSPSKNKNSK